MTLRIIKTLLGCALAIGIWCIGINLYLDSKQDKLKQDIYSQIDNILAGQNIIMDVLNYSVETEKVPMPEILKKNESFSDIKQFHLLNDGGFQLTILLKQTNDVYQIHNIRSASLGYRNEHYDYGIDMWPSVQGCYNSALEYFLEEAPQYKGAYTPNKWYEINSFPSLQNDYYRLIEYGTLSWGEAPHYISNYYWKVFYKITGIEYQLSFNKEARTNDFIKLLLIGVVMISVCGFIFSYKPKKKTTNASE